MKKNMPFYAFIVIMILFTAMYFTTTFSTSYAFPTGDETDVYDGKIMLINKAAYEYGENNPDDFNGEETIYITVNDLVEKGYIIADNENGEVKDPTSEIKTLNDLKVRITNKDGKIETKVLK